MDPRFHRLRRLFDRAGEADPVERLRLLADEPDEALRAEVEKLLQAREGAGPFLAEPTLRADDGVSAPPDDWLRQPHAGAYHLLEKLGEGAYGAVFLAEQQEPVRRRVAVKILKPGMDSAQVIARFEAERQTLAMMEHPGIARVFDAGTTEQGRPYFVMELVDGVPVTEYCARHRLSATGRLQLFGEVCRAVQHAHSKGIIHRDLKPSNILVCETDGKPQPKVIDFGIAKATRTPGSGHTYITELRQFMGTPAYMSPEQAALSGQEPDTRADIYSLGVVLYELLTGVTPFDASRLRAAALAEIHRVIAEEEPPRPSTRVSTLTKMHADGERPAFPVPERLLRGDLDWIVMKALEKEPQRRYETAAAFAEDVARHLASEPVLAGPPSAAYRLRKFVQRHRTGVTAAGIAVAAILTGLALAIHGWIRAREESFARAAEAEARRIQAERAEHLLALQNEIFESANPETAKGGTYTVRQLLDDFSVQFDAPLAVEREVEISLRLTVGRAYQALAEFAGAEKHFRTALDMAETHHGPLHRVTAAARLALGTLWRDAGRYNDARGALEQSLAAFKSQARHTEAGAATAVLADVLRRLNEPDKALAMAREVMPWPGEGPEGIRPLQLAADIMVEHGDYANALTAVRRALELARRADGNTEGPRAIVPMQTLAGLRLLEKQPAAAEEIAQRAVDIAERRLGAAHPVTQKARGTLADIHRETARAERAVLERSEVVTSLRQSLGDEHPETFEHFLGLVSAVTRNDPGSARDFVFRAIGFTGAGRDAGEVLPVNKMPAFIQNIIKSGRIGDYEGIAVKGLEFVRKAFGEDHRNTIDMERAVAYIYSQQKRWDDALAMHRAGIAKCVRVFGEQHSLTTETMLLEAQVNDDARRYDAFEQNIAGLAGRITARVPHDRATAEQLYWLAGLLEQQMRYGEALPLLAQSAQIFRTMDPAQTERLIWVLSAAGRCCRALGRQEASAEFWGQALEYASAVLNDSDRNLYLAAYWHLLALEGTRGWQQGIPLAEQWQERAAKGRPDDGDLIGMLRTRADVAARSGDERRVKATQARNESDRAAKEYGPHSKEALAQLRSWAAAAGRSGDREEMERVLASYETALRAARGENSLTGALHGALRASFRFLFSNGIDIAAAQAEALQILASLASPQGTDRDPAVARAIADCTEILRQTGLASEALRLTDTHEDQRTGNVWPAEKTIVMAARDAVWTHFVPKDVLPAIWLDAAFDDSSWRRGPGPIGFGNALLLHSSLKPVSRSETGAPVLLRHVFDVPRPEVIEKLKLRVRVLDGCAVHLNGTEVHRRNMPADSSFRATAPQSIDVFAPAIAEIILPDPSLLRAGKNVLAVELRMHANHYTPFRALCDVTLEALLK